MNQQPQRHEQQQRQLEPQQQQQKEKIIVSYFSSRQDFNKLLEKNPGLVILKLGATWCGPCKNWASNKHIPHGRRRGIRGGNYFTYMNCVQMASTIKPSKKSNPKVRVCTKA